MRSRIGQENQPAASMRPQRNAAENRQIQVQQGLDAVASMRPQRNAAENSPSPSGCEFLSIWLQ